MTTAIGIFVFPGVEELDFVGPWEVLRAWERTESADVGVSVFTLAVEPGPLQCAKGLTVTADHTWTTAPPIDVLVYPGGFGTRAHLGNDDVRAWVQGLAVKGTLMTSVCTGSLVYADAGLLDGRPATTHWGSLNHLAQLGRDIEVRPDDRYVDDGNIITAAGVSAGIDMALHLVRRLASEERARQVKRYIQYDPQPPVWLLPATGTPGTRSRRARASIRRWSTGTAPPRPARPARPGGGSRYSPATTT